MFHAASPLWTVEKPTVPVRGQLGSAVYSLNPHSARTVYEYGLAFLTDAAGCVTGSVSYQAKVVHDENKKMSVESSSITFSTGIHYLPQNNTTHAKRLSIRSPSKGQICKRGDNRAMMQCVAQDTIVCGFGLTSGGRIYSSVGHYAELQDDMNICTTDNKGNKYCCAMTQERWGKAGPYRAVMDGFGILAFTDKNNTFRGFLTTINLTPGLQPQDYMYRLTMQNDGNLIMYRGMDNSIPLWASHTQAPFPQYTVDTPCTGRLYMWMVQEQFF
ncbi:hypothetical protein BGZ79_002467 [Entomortierella chlamydospora]|nr:hypothetical protein BGZ79_002467 [Entomortierella chlamydospora]